MMAPRSHTSRSVAMAPLVSMSLVGFGVLHGCTGHVGKNSLNQHKGEVCTPDIASLQATVFTSCTAASCHNVNDKAAGLDLQSSSAESQLIGVTSGTCEGWTRIVPGQPDQSLFYAKLTGTPPCGASMPVGSRLSTEQLDCVQGWIASLTDPGDGGSGCPMCGGASCLDLSTDQANCGTCGHACPAGTTCTRGQCLCGGGLVACDTTCVDLQTNASHCGICGNACGAGETCSGGTCVCSGGLLGCSTGCIDSATDPSNCGGCGKACATGASCSEGQCACPTDTTVCNGACADVKSDPSNCGMCGHACASGEVCNAGTCASGCGSLTQCGASCVDTTTSVSNCGTCGKTCPVGATCAGAVCTCSAGSAACNGVCTSITTNINCGGCGKVCAAGTSCTNGSCQCNTGLSLCGASCTNTQTDVNNCGTCGHICPSAQTCQSGNCNCPNGGTLCGNTCALLPSDSNNCGRCGNACALGQTCSSSMCTCGPSVSFSGAVQPIFTASCSSNGCHSGAMPQQGLNLGTGKSYSELVNVAASQCSDGRKLVVPSSPSTSYLMGKLLGVDMCAGSQMPKAGQGLPSLQIQTIANWICNGAPNN